MLLIIRLKFTVLSDRSGEAEGHTGRQTDGRMDEWPLFGLLDLFVF